jgi:hypothetical protein
MHDDLVPKLRCSRCDKKVGLIVARPTKKVNPFAARDR